MKCMYYLAPTLVSTSHIAEDLHDVGIEDWNVHVISKDEAGLKNDKLNSSNWLETTDLLRDGFIGANVGFILGVLVAGSLLLIAPFGPDIPTIAYFFMVALTTGFGAWVGGLTGIDSDNQKLRRFRSAIDEGKYLILIYARKGTGEAIKKMMRERHPESHHAATDRHFINPFAGVRRRRQERRKDQAYD